MRKIIRVKIGDYVFLSFHPDRDKDGPWAVGWISEHGTDLTGKFYRVGGSKIYRHAWKITKSEGGKLIKKYMRFSLMDDG